MRAWISDNPDKRRSIPAGVCLDLMAMLRQKSSAAKALANEIEEESPDENPDKQEAGENS